MSPVSLTIFFPMYNESENIEAVLKHVDEVVPELGFEEYEVLFIDDGSKDGCDRIVADWAQRNAHVRMVQHPQNRGYGQALCTGFKESRSEAVFYTDSDLPVDLMDLQKALPLLKDADLVTGYRIERHETLRRAVYSRIYNTLMRVLFGVRVRDVNFSFKLMKKEVLDRIHLTAETVFVDGQLLAEAQRCGFRIAEIPIEYRPRELGHSSFDSLRVAWQTLMEMLSYWVRKNRGGA